jgi:hypothetical protein
MKTLVAARARMPAWLVAALIGLAGAAPTQGAEALNSAAQEAASRARVEAVLARVQPLLEAERLHPRLAGVWRITAPVTALRTIEGREPPLNAAGMKLYRTRAAGRSADPMERCLPPGTPRSMWADAPLLITQAPAKVTVFHQFRHVIRHVFLDGPLRLEDPDPTWEGISSGRWEDGTLIIETAAFNGDQWLDAAGLPQSPQMKVTERLRLLDPGTLEDVVTIEDPRYYRVPWTTRATYRRLPEDTELPEEECAERLLEFPLRPYAPNER